MFSFVCVIWYNEIQSNSWSIVFSEKSFSDEFFWMDDCKSLSCAWGREGLLRQRQKTKLFVLNVVVVFLSDKRFTTATVFLVSYKPAGGGALHVRDIAFFACSRSTVKVLYFLSAALRNDDRALAAHQSWARCGGSYPGWLWSRNTTTSAGTVGPPSSGTRASCLPPRENISMRKEGEGLGCRGRINP